MTHYRGWKLLNREELLEVFEPRFERVVAHHITLDLKGGIPEPVTARVVGYASDDIGLEALVVSVDGTTVRPDGSIFHITWSLGSGYRPVDSKRIVKQGWVEIDPIDIVVVPFCVTNGVEEFT
jgi:hypothetical protein